MLDLARLRVLVAVAEARSLTAAGAALSFSQPAISRQMAALEREAGLPLLVRHPRGVQLTPAGELLADHARAVLERLSLAEDQLGAIAHLDAGRLRLGSFSSANTALVPEAVNRFRARHPAIELSLSGGVPRDHLAQLRAGDLDLAVVTNWDCAPGEFAEVDLVSLLHDELLVALPADHPLTTRRRLQLVDLAGQIWIEGAHPDCLGPLERVLQARGITARIGFHCDDWTGKLGLVAAGAGITLFPTLALPSARPDVVLRRVHRSELYRQVYLARPTGSYRNPAAGSMIEVLRQVSREHPADTPGPRRPTRPSTARAPRREKSPPIGPDARSFRR